MERARGLGAYRFNTGKLMRIGTAARLWHKLEPSREQYRRFRELLDTQATRFGDDMRLCYDPFTIGEALLGLLQEAPATVLLLPNGKVKVAAALPYICADLRRHSLAQAWDAYRSAWRDEALQHAIRLAGQDESRHGDANKWQPVPVLET
jgi:hypothetical protein